MTRRAMKRLGRGATSLCALSALTVVSGCVELSEVALRGTGDIGPAVFELTVCASDPATATCKTGGNAKLFTSGTTPGQLLVALNMPVDVAPPASVTSSSGQLVVTESPSYTAELQSITPSSAGRKWVGYISASRLFTPGSSATFEWTLPRPRAADGGPAPSTLLISAIAGSRITGSTTDVSPDRPVECGNVEADLAGKADNTVCRDSQGFSQNGGFRDLQLTPGAAVTIAPGQSASVPITARFAGSGTTALKFSLAATTTIPGGSATPPAVVFTPTTDSASTLGVSVAVPANAAPGSYAVTLSGTLPSGESRAATASVVVPGAGTTPGTPGGTTPGTTTGATAVCGGRQATIVGTAGPDTLVGTTGPDVIAGLAGNDTVTGLGGDDVICGDEGDDRLKGGAGADRVIGGLGADRLFGGPDADILNGGPGNDRLVGGGGLDRLTGGGGINVRIQ